MFSLSPADLYWICNFKTVLKRSKFLDDPKTQASQSGEKKKKKKKKKNWRFGLSLQSGSFLRSWLVVWLNVGWCGSSRFVLMGCCQEWQILILLHSGFAVWVCKMGESWEGNRRGRKREGGCWVWRCHSNNDSRARSKQRKEWMPTKQEGRRRGEQRHLEGGSMKCFSNCQVFQQILCRKTKTTLQPHCYCNCCCHPTFLSWNFTPLLTHFHHHHHHASSCNKIKLKKN